MNGASEFILNSLLNSIWQIPVIWLLALSGTYLLRNCSAHYRHTVWTIALLLCLISPALTASQRILGTTVVATLPVVTITNHTDDDEIVPDHTRRRNSHARNSHMVIDATTRDKQLVAAAYLLFLVFGAVRFVRLWIAKERLRRSASFAELTQPIMDATRRCMTVFAVDKVRVARSLTARVPCTVGVRRPLIVLPESFCGDVDQETLVSVIGHEMAHVQRRDFLTKLACEVVSLPISFHPFTFLIKRRIERERELACDELVTQRVLRPETYARSLLRAADLSILRAQEGMMLSVFDGRMLEQRIRRLTSNRSSLSSFAGRMITAAVVAALCVSTVLGSAFGFSLRTPADLPSLLATPVLLATPAAPAARADQEPVVTKPNNQEPVPTPNRGESSTAQQLAQAACEAGRNRDLEATPSLVAMLADDRKTEPVECWKNGRWSPALDTFKHPSPGEEAALALASMGRAALTPLVNQLDSPNATTRRNAAWAIGELTNMVPGERTAAVPRLIALLSDSDAWVRMAAARAIGEVRDARAGEMLISTLSDADWRVRRLAAWALNEMKDKRAVTALCQLLLGDSRAEVRRAAAEALGEIASAEALPALQQALNDPETAVRVKVSWAIAEIEDN